jgi:hypothetical protein
LRNWLAILSPRRTGVCARSSNAKEQSRCTAIAALRALGRCRCHRLIALQRVLDRPRVAQGATAVGIVAIVCSLFSSFDDPIPAMSSFTIGLVASIPLALIYQFGILPAVDGFTLLVASLAPAFIPIGVLMAIPRYTLIGLPLAVGMNLNLALQTRYNADMAVFLNTSIAIAIASVDGVIGELLVVGSSSARHKGLAAAVGLRRNLYPDARLLPAGRPAPVTPATRRVRQRHRRAVSVRPRRRPLALRRRARSTPPAASRDALICVGVRSYLTPPLPNP